MLGKACPREIHISSSVNMGFIVQIGCAHLVYTDVESLILGIKAYLKDPKGKEKEYNSVCGMQDGTIYSNPMLIKNPAPSAGSLPVR